MYVATVEYSVSDDEGQEVFKNYVAVDDGALFAKFLVDHFVQPKDGLEEEHVEKAVEILNG